MSTSKLPPHPLHLNVLQPKKLNTTTLIAPIAPIINNGDDIVKEAGAMPPKKFSNILAPTDVVLPSIVPPRGIGFAKLLSLSMSSGSGSLIPEQVAATSTTVKRKCGGGYKRAVHTMAKRNARERNRVKLVNQGFQTLRHHIPEKFRLKKMSKVDTLRCALDYIRSLSQVLDIESYDNSSSNSTITDQSHQSLNEMSMDDQEGSLNTCGTSDESMVHCSAEEYTELSSIMSSDSFQAEQQHRHFDVICNSNNSIAQQQQQQQQQLVESESTLKSASIATSHHLLFKNKLSHSGTTFNYNNGNIVESENKQANGLILVLPPSTSSSSSSSSSSSNFLNQNRIYTSVNNNSDINIGRVVVRDHDSNRVGKENEEYILIVPKQEVDEEVIVSNETDDENFQQ